MTLPVNLDGFNLTETQVAAILSIIDARTVGVDQTRSPVSVDSSGKLWSGSSPVSGAGKRAAPPLFDIFDLQAVGPRQQLSLPNPYSAVGPDMVHPGALYVPQGWRGYRFWLAYTPYPTANSAYENPCIACSQDGWTWTTPTGAPLPLIDKPSGANNYNADTHLVLSPDLSSLYLIYRERIATGTPGNNVRVMESTNGANWSSPRTVLSGAYGAVDYASPSVFWDAANTRWVMISHNLDGGVAYPMQRNVTSGADIYSGWGANAAITITNPTGGRTWWHSAFDLHPDGVRIIGLVQDIANGGAGAPGALFAAESWDGGLTFAVKQIYADPYYYRPSLTLMDTTNGANGMHAWLGRQTDTYHIAREDWLPGADKAAVDGALQELAAYGTYRTSVLYFDNYNRADGAIGTPAVGAALTVDTGTFTIVSNRIVTGSAGNNRAMVSLGRTNYIVETTYSAAAGAAAWLIFRGVDTTNFFRIGVGAGVPATLYFERIVGGSVAGSVQVKGPFYPYTLSAGDRISVRCRGARFRVFVNDVFWAEFQDPNFSATGVKIGLQGTNAGIAFDRLVAFA